MRYTNKHNLPHAVMAVAMNDQYSKGDADISVTELIAPVRHRIMRQIHEHELERDVSLEVVALLGTALHELLHKVDEPNDVAKEERLYAEVNGWVISGQIDRHQLPMGKQAKPLISDYKVCKARAVQGLKREWVDQINLYRWLVWKNYKHIPDGEIVAFIADWSKARADKDETYPQAPIVKVKMPSNSIRKVEQYIKRRVQEHQDAQALYDQTGNLPACTPEERWSEGDTWAVISGSRTVKKCYSENEAQVHVRQMMLGTRVGKTKPTRMKIEKRPGMERRCEGGWCDYAPHCSQIKRIVEDRQIEEVLASLDEGKSK